MPASYPKIALIAGFAVGSLALAALKVLNPTTAILFPPCPFHALTGLYCPGCGSLRALHELLNGHGRAALAMNPLAVAAFPCLLYGLVSQASWQIRGRGLPHLFIPGSWIWGLAATIVTFGIVRNIPLAPFNLLAPGAMLGL